MLSQHPSHDLHQNFATPLPTIFLKQNLGMPPEKKPQGKKPSEKKPSEKDNPEEKKPPEKRYVPGWDPVSDDEKGKGAKKSRRGKKSGNKDETSEAGPSVQIAPSPLLDQSVSPS